MARRPFTGIELEHVAGFEIPDSSGSNVLITPDDLRDDVTEVGTVHPLKLLGSLTASEQEELLSPEFLLRNVVLRMLTLRIRGDSDLEMPPVTFNTTLRYNYPTRGETHGHTSGDLEIFSPDEQMLTYSVRFVPTEGIVAGIDYNDDRRISSWGLGMFSASSNVTKVVMHNSVYAEIYHMPQEGQIAELPMPHEVIRPE